LFSCTCHGGIVGSCSPSSRPAVEVDHQALRQRGERGQLAQRRDAVADPHLDGAERGEGRTSQRMSDSPSMTPVG
jgi:hypothetical protein